ncbi:MAG: Helix-turn-helix domain [Blastocatellia bacterium]|jgi:transcriptional regulator with XRE-family HTH domain|nr:Helix-turn-helix domain [Blastocatellia bacterium]
MGRTKRDYPRKLARKLKKIRVGLKLSQGEIAERLGVKDRASISQYENGKIEPPLPLLLKYARLAGISTDVLIDDKLSLPK